MTTPSVTKTTNFAATLRVCRELGLPEISGKRLGGNVRYNALKALSLLLTGLTTPPPDEAVTTSDGPAATDWLRIGRQQGDEGLGRRAADAFLQREVRRQGNREAVARLMVELLVKGGPGKKDSPREIEDDWLDIFGDIAAAKSAPDIQKLLARLLVAEIRKPGSFSPAAVHAIGMMTRKTAGQFRRFCGICLRNPGISFVITSPWPDFRQKGDAELGIKYQDLLDLQSAGLLPAALSSNLDLKPHINRTSFTMADRCIVIAQDKLEALPKLPQLDVILLTPVGHELREITEPVANPEYQARVEEWFRSQGLVLSMVS